MVSRAQSNGSSTTGTYTYPTTPTAGNLLTCAVAKFHTTSGQEFVAPSGWTKATDGINEFANGNTYVAVFYKISDGNDAGPHSIGNFSAPCMSSWDEWAPGSGNAWPTNPVADTDWATDNTNVGTLVVPSLTTSVTDGVMVGALGLSGSNTNPQISNGASIDAYQNRGGYSKILTSSGATGSFTLTWNTNRRPLSHAVAFETEASGGGGGGGGTGDITYVGSGSMGTSYNNAVIPLPASVQEGDFLLAHVYVQNADSTIPSPSGWTALASVLEYDMGDHIRWYYKFAGASETDLTLDNSAKNAGGVMEAFRGVHASNPISGAPVAQNNGSGTPKTITPSSFTTTHDNSFVIVCGAFNDMGAVSLDTPNGFTSSFLETTGQGTDWGHISTRKKLATSGSTDTPIFDLVTSGTKLASVVFELRASTSSQLSFGWGFLLN